MAHSPTITSYDFVNSLIYHFDWELSSEPETIPLAQFPLPSNYCGPAVVGTLTKKVTTCEMCSNTVAYSLACPFVSTASLLASVACCFFTEYENNLSDTSYAEATRNQRVGHHVRMMGDTEYARRQRESAQAASEIADMACDSALQWNIDLYTSYRPCDSSPKVKNFMLKPNEYEDVKKTICTKQEQPTDKLITKSNTFE